MATAAWPWRSSRRLAALSQTSTDADAAAGAAAGTDDQAAAADPATAQAAGSGTSQADAAAGGGGAAAAAGTDATGAASNPTTAVKSSSSDSSSSNDTAAPAAAPGLQAGAVAPVEGSAAAVLAVPLKPRITAMSISPVQFTSISWSLASSPLQKSFPDGTAAVGCRLTVSPVPPVSAPLLTGTFRLGNPMAGDRPTAQTIRVKLCDVL